MTGTETCIGFTFCIEEFIQPTSGIFSESNIGGCSFSRAIFYVEKNFGSALSRYDYGGKTPKILKKVSHFFA